MRLSKTVHLCGSGMRRAAVCVWVGGWGGEMAQHRVSEPRGGWGEGGIFRREGKCDESLVTQHK